MRGVVVRVVVDEWFVWSMDGWRWACFLRESIAQVECRFCALAVHICHCLSVFVWQGMLHAFEDVSRMYTRVR